MQKFSCVFVDGTSMVGRGEVHQLDADNSVLYFTSDEGAFFRINFDLVAYFYTVDESDE